MALTPIQQSIHEAVKRGASHDQIVQAIAKQNPSVASSIQEATKRGAKAVDIVSQIVAQNGPVDEYEKRNKRSQELYKPAMPADPRNETAVSAAKKSAVNFIPSLYNAGKGLVNAVSHPIKTASSLGNVLVGAGEHIGEAVLNKDIGPTPQKQAASQMGQFLKERHGGSDFNEVIENNLRTAINDPFGFGSEIFGLARTGASLAGKKSAFDSGVSRVAQTVEKPFKSAGSETASFGKEMVSKATGLDRSTMQTAANNPSAFLGKNDVTRAGLGNKVYTSIVDKADELSETGKAYEAIRKTGNSVTVPKGSFEQLLNNKGISIKNGKIVTTAESIPMSSGDKAALQSFYDTYGKLDKMSPNAFLNARKSLSNMAKYDAVSGKTDAATLLAKETRSFYDALGKKQIQGLDVLDKKYAPAVQTLNKLKSSYFDKDGMLKDSAFTKIANLTAEKNPKELARLEALMPGVTTDIKILKALQDVNYAGGNKVGTYFRNIGIGGAVYTGNVPALIGAIMTNPSVAVKLIAAYGKVRGVSAPVVNGVISKVQSGSQLLANEKAFISSAMKSYMDSGVK